MGLLADIIIRGISGHVIPFDSQVTYRPNRHIASIRVQLQVSAKQLHAADMHSRFFKSLVVLFCLVTTISAGSYYANDDPESCDVIGDVSMYGLGIRLG